MQVCNGLAQGLDRGNKKVKDAAKTVVASVTDSATTLTNGVAKTVETVTERMANGATQQKQTITETSRQMVGGVLKDIKTVTSIAADGTETVKQTMETVRETAKTVTSTFETLADGVKTTTQTVTETLTDGTETQKQVITEVYDDVVDGALVTVEKIKTVAADAPCRWPSRSKSPALTPLTACGRRSRPKQIPACLAPSMTCTPPSRIRTGWASASGWQAPSTAV